VRRVSLECTHCSLLDNIAGIEVLDIVVGICC
jgi:hypothetical protein